MLTGSAAGGEVEAWIVGSFVLPTKPRRNKRPTAELLSERNELAKFVGDWTGVSDTPP